MSEKITSSIFPNLIRGSHIDYGRALQDSLLVDASRKPYFLARLAVLQFNKTEFSDSSRVALFHLSTAQEDGVLQPPLSLPLENEINAFRQSTSLERNISHSNYAAFILLNMAIDEGSRPGA